MVVAAVHAGVAVVQVAVVGEVAVAGVLRRGPEKRVGARDAEPSGHGAVASGNGPEARSVVCTLVITYRTVTC